MYKVKLNEGHTATPLQTTPEGYLSLFESEAPMLYDTNKIAQTMAKKFGGTPEEDELSKALATYKVMTVDVDFLTGKLKEFITNSFRKNTQIDSEMVLSIIQAVLPTIEDRELTIDLKKFCQYVIGCQRIILV